MPPPVTCPLVVHTHRYYTARNALGSSLVNRAASSNNRAFTIYLKIHPSDEPSLGRFKVAAEKVPELLT